jgi:cob(I)alamin adenosyltransferase
MKKRKGDLGFTDLPGGKIVKKTDPRIAALAALDELSCALGVARAALAKGKNAAVCARIKKIQLLLITLCGDVAGMDAAAALENGVLELEKDIAALKVKLPREFILPGENMNSALLHAARAKCRTAELAVCALRNKPAAAKYLNRLSSYLFSLALKYSA